MIERIWIWIKDHPGCAVEAIALTFKVDRFKVSGVVSDLFYRRMLRRDFGPKKPNTTGKPAFVYTAIGRSYELLPDTRARRNSAVAKSEQRKKAVATLKTSEPEGKSTPTDSEVEVPTVLNPPLDKLQVTSRKKFEVPLALENCTLLECREIYDYLARFFKD